MTKTKLDKMPFEKQMEWACANIDDVTTKETLIRFAVEKIQNDYFKLATHILNAIDENPYHTEYYRYDYCMGMLDTPTPINELDDIEDLIFFDEE